MGMFDTIQWGDNLPFSEEMKGLGLAKNDWSFQTKDLDCCLTDYVVQDGFLFRKKYKNEKWVEGDVSSKNWLDRFGLYERTEPYLESEKVTDTIYMYEYRQDVLGLWDCSAEFKVVFIDGKVQSTELFSFEKSSNAERKQHELEWQQRVEYTKSRWYNRFVFHTTLYRWISRKIARLLHRIGTLLQELSYKL